MTPTSAVFFHVDLLTLCVTCFQLEGLPLVFLVRQEILLNLFIWFISSLLDIGYCLTGFFCCC